MMPTVVKPPSSPQSFSIDSLPLELGIIRWGQWGPANQSRLSERFFFYIGRREKYCPYQYLSICIEAEMWWLIGSALDSWGRSPGFQSGISHNDPDALQDHCAIM